MHRLRRSRGFTIVELLVVIVVLAILATLVFVAYDKSQMQARDTKMRDAADKFADAIKTMHARNGSFPAGGLSSTTSANATTGCADGANGFQTYNYLATNANYKCTLGDAAVATGLLPDTLFTGLPKNTRFGTSADVFMVYSCNSKYYLFYAVEDPAAAETAAINALIVSCASLASARDTYGMRGVKELSV